MKKVFFALVALMGLMCHQAQAQMIIDTWNMTTGVDTTVWYDIDGVDSVIIAPGNKLSARSGLVSIGFDFTLGETTHTQFSTNINGTVRLGNVQIPSSGYYSQPLGSQSQIGIGSKIEPFGWRGRFDNTCYTRKALLGTAGNRVLVIETRMKDCGYDISDSLYVSFQVQLFEAGGFRIVYGDADSGALTHTTQNGVTAIGSAPANSDKDIVFIDFATHEMVRFDVNCTLTNAADTWPEKGRWYRLVYDSTLCPYPPMLIASNTDPASVSLLNYDGGTNDLHVVIPAMGIDTLWASGTGILYLGGGFNPNTRYQGTVQTVCGSDTSFRTRSFSFSTFCGTVVYLPWVSEFENYSLNCWEASQYTSTSYQWHGSNGYAACGGYANNYHYDEWLISPVLNLPNDDGLVMKFQYRAENDQQNRSNTVEVRVAPCTAAGVVDTADWTTVMTLTGAYPNSIERRVFLDAWRGQTVKVAFVLTGIGGNGAYLDRVEFLQELEPVFTLAAPTHARTGESVALTAHYVTGVTTGLTYTWHSSLLDSTFNGVNGLTLVYSSAGTDTVTLVVSNAYGADTLTAIYPVVECPTVTALPWTETFYGGSRCWYVPAGSNWHDGKPYSYYAPYYDDTYRALVSTYADDTLDHWIISPAIEMPADTTDTKILEWNEAAEIGAATHQPNYSVLVSTDSNFLDLTTYDTLLTVNSGVVSAGGTWQNWGRRNVSLAAYAGETIHVAFCRHPSYYGVTGEGGVSTECLLIDNVTVRSASAPVITLTAPTQVESYDTVIFTATLVEGLPCSYTWHSSLMNQWSVAGSQWSMVYTVGGTDTVKVVATNAFGSDSATVVVQVIDCTPITLPWLENFDALIGTNYSTEGPLPDCWRSYWNGTNAVYAPHVIGTYLNPISSYFTSGQQALLLMAGTTSGWDSVAIVESPVVATPLNQMMLSFYYQQESSSRGILSVGYMQDSVFVSVTDLPQQQTGNTITVSLGAFPADVHRFALQWQYVGMWYGVIIDNMELTAFDSVPTVAIVTPEQVGGDSVLFHAYLTNGLPDSLTYSWQSTMAAAGQAILTATGDSAYVVYTAPGTDTVSVIATNAYGVDTAWVQYTYMGAPVAAITGPSSVLTDDTNTYAAYLLAGSRTGISYSWQSTMSAAGQATMLVTGDTLRMVYLAGGTDTLTLITTNAFGVDTTRRSITVTGCHITTFPWTEGFENGLPSCWSTWTNNSDEWMHSWRLSNQAYEAHSGSRCMWSQNLTGDYMNTQDWLMMPPVEVPASSNMSLNFYAWFSGNNPDYTGLAVLVSTQGNSNLSHFTDTIFFEQASMGWSINYAMRSASLAAYAGQTIWIAFVHANRCMTLRLDDISIDNTDVPVAGISGPTEQLSSEEALFTAHLLNGDTAGVTYTWHSTMAAAGLATLTATDSTATIEYHAGGTDHVSVVIANAAGSDSVAMTCSVTDCEPITQLPYTVRLNSSNNITCWQKSSGWHIGDYFSSGITAMQYKNWNNDSVDSWFIMREIAIPDDYTQSYTLRWHLLCDHSKYQVLVSTQGRSSHSLFDTLYYEQNDTASSFYSNQWASRTLSLDAYRGQNIYIAFRNLGWYNSPTSYADIGVIRIDTIQVLVSSDTQTYRTLTLDVNDPMMGTASGAGVYPDSSLVTISATPFEGYRFDSWDDGDTNAVRTLLLVSDTTFTAYFAADSLPTPPPDTVWYTVTVNAVMDDGSHEDGLDEMVHGAGTYVDGSTVTLEGDVYGCSIGLSYWITAEGDTLYNNPYTFVIHSDVTLTAVFAISGGIGEVEGGVFSIYPNPASTTVTVETDQPSTLTLTDATGRECGQWKVAVGKTTLDISTLPTGVYFVRLSTSPTVRKLMIR